MKKDGERECRARGGHVPAHHHSPPKHRAKHARGGHANASHKNVINEFYGAQPDNEPDDEEHGGRLHRRRGGKAHHMKHGGHLPAAFVAHEHHAHGGHAPEHHAHHHVDGEGHKPHGGRAHRKRGGRAHHSHGGSALNPISHNAGKQPHGVHVTPEHEKSP